MSRGRHAKPTNTARNVKRAGTGSFAVLLTSLPLSGSTAQAAPASQAEWDAIIHCESGGDPKAENNTSTASGLYQIIDGTWRANGGVTDFGVTHASDATVEQQHEIARRIYQNAGDTFRDWNASRHCWEPLMASGAFAVPQAPTPPPVVEETPAEEPPVITEEIPDEDAPTEVIVEAGDTLSEIAIEKMGLPEWEQLYAQNVDVVGANPHLIFPGQQLHYVDGLLLPVPPIPVFEPPAPTVVEEAASVQEAPAPPAAEVVPDAAELSLSGYANPVPGGTFTSAYRSQDRPSHDGIDIAAPTGTPVYAAHDGIVQEAGWQNGGFGAWVRVLSADGVVETWYGHIDTWLVNKGDFVAAGQQIATVGNRGNSTGPHLHFEVHFPDGNVDPRAWLANHGVNV